MDQHQVIRIEPSTFKFIASLDIWCSSIIKDESIFPPADSNGWSKLLDQFLVSRPHFTPFSVTSNDLTPRRFEYQDRFMQISPSPAGLPTIRDFDVLIYCATWVANASKGGRLKDISAVYQLDVEDLYAFTGRARGSERENNLIQGLERLARSRLETNTTPCGLEADSFNLLLKYRLDRDEQGRLKAVTLKLPHRYNHLAYNGFFDELHQDYFALSAVRRLIYLYLKQHCGGEDGLTISFAKLHEITGVTSPLRKFIPVIQELTAKPLPEFSARIDSASETLFFIGV